MPNLTFPNCGQMDQVGKVSGIYARGVASGSFTGPTGGIAYGDGVSALTGYTWLSRQLQSRLSEQLKPPSEPKMNQIGIYLLRFGCAGGLVALACAGLALVPTLSYALFVESNKLPYVLPVFVLFALPIVFFGVSLYGLVVVNPREQSEYSAKVHAWQKAKAKWETLLYCARCDIAFHPDETQAIKPANLNSYYYS